MVLEVLNGQDSLASWEDVYAAGTLKIRDGGIIRIDNASGHYTPGINQTSQFKSMFEKLGAKVDKAAVQILNEDSRIIHQTQPKTNK